MERFIENKVYIKAPLSRVWNALIDPQMTTKYMFGCEVICEWNIGDNIIWKGADDGVTYVKGTLVEFRPKEKLAFTVFDPHGSYADVPSNYLLATYILAEDTGGTQLSVTQGDYTKVEEGAKRYEDTMSRGGWASVLQKIKVLVEGSLESD